MSTITVTNTRDHGQGSLRAAITTAKSGDTIRFNKALTNKTITLTSGQITIDPGKKIIIDGANAAGLTLSGNNKSRIFFVNSNQDFPANLILKDLTLTKGFTDERGGAIHVTHKGDLIIKNVDFEQNRADQGGGAIYSAWETNLSVTGSTFERNQATAANDERGAGAIAFTSPGKFIVKDSVFANNKGINGGAINSLQGKLTIANSTFINNDTTAAVYDKGQPRPFLRGYGGAIYTDRASSASDDTAGIIRISNSIFEGNKGRGEGGAAYLYTGAQDKVLLEHSRFSNNQVLALPNRDNGGNGGAVVQLTHGLNRGLAIRNTSFSNNRADGQGGGLWMMGAPTQITNSTFSGNRTLGKSFSSGGGGITLYGPTDIDNTTFANNRAGWVGGAISANTKKYKVTVKDSIFYKNTAENGPNDWGIQQHTSSELQDLGGNFQYPPKTTNNFNDYNATAKVKTTINPKLSPLQADGTHIVGHPIVAKVGDQGNTKIRGLLSHKLSQNGNGGNVPGSKVQPALTDTPIRPDLLLIKGTAQNDTLPDDNRSQTLRGFSGNDLVKAKGGKDLVYGGRGKDKLYG
ncbi:MAG: calcium-binding protein [Cyanothece sp. SIO1E1]|nr:calcium-binding protein [Cyanothece sp. SIO1E1]